jgi:phosphomevalonate kinase
MRDVEVSAPGKLFVIGEYAVLHGARSLLVALDARITARAERSRRWRLLAPDLGFETPLEDVLPDSGAALLAASVATARDELRIAEAYTIIVRGSTAASRRKHGLGGSAASVVAILGALVAARGADVADEATRSRLFSLALSVHRAHQRGRGSGADVAASVYGGWIEYAIGEGVPRLSSVTVPRDMQIAAAWSGVASDTARAIAAFDPQAHLRPLLVILEHFWEAIRAVDRDAIVREIDAYGRKLEGFGAGEGAERIARLSMAARALGWAAKGSGAVGGDCAIAIGFGDREAGALEHGWRAAGAQPLDVSVAVDGVHAVCAASGEELHA